MWEIKASVTKHERVSQSRKCRWEDQNANNTASRCSMMIPMSGLFAGSRSQQLTKRGHMLCTIIGYFDCSGCSPIITQYKTADSMGSQKKGSFFVRIWTILAEVSDQWADLRVRPTQIACNTCHAEDTKEYTELQTQVTLLTPVLPWQKHIYQCKVSIEESHKFTPKN
jgi:hypothetical protein